MAKGKKRVKLDQRGPLQKLLDREQVANDQSVLSVITPEMRAKGTYDGERRIVNNHDPVQRWIGAGKLTEGQQHAIRYVRRLWDIAGLERPVTANYGMVRQGAGCADPRTARLGPDLGGFHAPFRQGLYAGTDPDRAEPVRGTPCKRCGVRDEMHDQFGCGRSART